MERLTRGKKQGGRTMNKWNILIFVFEVENFSKYHLNNLRGENSKNDVFQNDKIENNFIILLPDFCC